MKNQPCYFSKWCVTFISHCFFLQTNHMRSLTDFVEAQACYFDECNQHAQELQKQLARSVGPLYNTCA